MTTKRDENYIREQVRARYLEIAKQSNSSRKSGCETVKGDWFPGSNMENYVRSGLISAFK